MKKNKEIIELLEQVELTKDTFIKYFITDENAERIISIGFDDLGVELEYNINNQEITTYTCGSKIDEKQFAKVVEVFTVLQNISKTISDIPVAAPQVSNATERDMEEFWRDYEDWQESQMLSPQRDNSDIIKAITLFDENNCGYYCALKEQPVKYIDIYAIIDDECYEQAVVVYQDGTKQMFAANSPNFNCEVNTSEFNDYEMAYVYEILPKDIESWESLAYADQPNIAAYRKDFFINIAD